MGTPCSSGGGDGGGLTFGTLAGGRALDPAPWQAAKGIEVFLFFKNGNIQIDIKKQKKT